MAPRKIDNEKIEMKSPPIVSEQEWETERMQLLVKEKEILVPIAKRLIAATTGLINSDRWWPVRFRTPEVEGGHL